MDFDGDLAEGHETNLNQLCWGEWIKITKKRKEQRRSWRKADDDLLKHKWLFIQSTYEPSTYDF